MKTVRDILAKKPSHFNTVDLNDKVIDAIALMARQNINYVIVKGHGKYVGIFTERNYTRKVILAGRDSKNTKVGEVMSKDIPVADIADTSHACCELMHTFKTTFLPVFEGFYFKGVITLSDLLKESVDENRHMTDGKYMFITF